MFGSNILEVAIGLIFVFILVSTICTAVREGIESWLKTRAAYLEHGIRELLKDPKGTGIVKNLYEHPLIFGLFNGDYTPGTKTGKPDTMASGNNLPSYIPSKNFAIALMDIAARGPVTDNANATAGAPIVSLETIRANIAQIGNPYVQRLLLNAIDTAQGDLNKAQANIENWYNSSMDRVSGWYKRSTQTVIFCIAITVTLLLNINAITVLNYLSQNDTARKVVVERAATISKDSTYKSKDYEAAKTELDNLKLPVGWNGGWKSIAINPSLEFRGYFYWTWNWVLGPLLGLLFTAFAATLGAPFWFDMLNKVMVIRSTVKPHQKSGEESSDDAQSAQPRIVIAAAAVPQPANTVQGGVTGAGTEIDGCDVVATQLTADDELPESKGGMA